MRRPPPGLRGLSHPFAPGSLLAHLALLPDPHSRHGQHFPRTALHARNVPVSPALARRYNLTTTGGVEVLAVEEGAPADQAGLEEEDVIVALDEQPTTTVDDLHKLLTTLPVGLPATVTLLRGERRLERMVVPTEYPNPAPRV